MDNLVATATKPGHFSPALRKMARELSEAVKAFSAASRRAAVWQLLSTSLLFFPIIALMFVLAGDFYILSLLLALPAGALLTRFFALQHDCGHGSLFPDKASNEAIGKVISILTFTPFDYWRRSHAAHHASSGNLERRGIGDVETLTVREYVKLGFWSRLRYRIMRNPIVGLIIGPPLYFLVLQRFMITRKLGIGQSLKSVLPHDVVLVSFYAGLAYAFGVGLTLSVVLPVVLVAAWIGGFLFYVQHQFEETLWEGADEWDVKVAALQGSSHLVLPRILNWFTCDIGIHHVHHLSSRIPNYRLRECLNALPQLQTIAPKLTAWDAAKTVNLALWDEASRKLISFGEFKRRYSQTSATFRDPQPALGNKR